jgi:cytochrome c oxidase assembly protein subunit 15
VSWIRSLPGRPASRFLSSRLLATPAALRRFALAAIVTNVGIVITGGAVRLTGSGLGCPTWPRCTADSFVATEPMGVNGAIEFGNRLLTFAVGLVALLAVLAVLAQRARPPRALPLALLVLAGIPAQAVVGGVTVLTDLNPWVVGCHFLVSIMIIAAAFGLWRAVGGGRTADRAAPPAVRALGAVTVAASAAVLVLGTVVTGSGPHAGDADARRTGLDPEAVSHLHANGVFLLVGLTIGLWLATRAAGGPARVVAILLGVELAQGLIGFVQYVTELPVVLVGLHMAGACAVWLATLAAYAALLPVPPAASTRPAGPAVGEPPYDLPPELTRPAPGRPAGSATTGSATSGSAATGSARTSAVAS